MDIFEAMKNRHSVRRYTDRKIEGETLEALVQAQNTCNTEGNLNIQLCLEETAAFASGLMKYGAFRNVRNYIAIVGPDDASLPEKGGYYGEKLVLRAQQLGLNTCWVAATFSKKSCTAKIASNEKLLMVIAIGYGENQGTPHKGRSLEKLCQYDGEMSPWFKSAMEAVSLAPTAINQQKFRFILRGNSVTALAGRGVHTETDLGIAKCHFELGAGDADWSWTE